MVWEASPQDKSDALLWLFNRRERKLTATLYHQWLGPPAWIMASSYSQLSLEKSKSDAGNHPSVCRRSILPGGHQPSTSLAKILILTQRILTSFFNHSHPPLPAPTALQPDGKLIVVGTAHHNFLIARYIAQTALLDPLFGSFGRVTIDFGGNDFATGVAVRADGDILITGTSGRSFAMADLKSDGTLNHAFGHMTGRIRGSFRPKPIAQRIECLLSLLMVKDFSSAESQPMGRITARSSSNSSRMEPPTRSGIQRPREFQTSPALKPRWRSNPRRKSSSPARWETASSSLASTGMARSMPPSAMAANESFSSGNPHQDVHGIAIDPRNNSIVLSGSEGSGAKSTFAIARLTANGKLDTTFNSSGPIRGTAQSFVKNAACQRLQRPSHRASSGNVIAVGTANGNFAIAEFTPPGQLDKHFDSDDLATTDQGATATDIATALANPNDGSIYLAGTSGSDFSVAALPFHRPRLERLHSSHSGCCSTGILPVFLEEPRARCPCYI